MSTALRLIDANANRAREALRVMEDVARFSLDDAALCAALKSLRHDLRAALEPLESRGNLLAWRDSPGDVGATISTHAEGVRHSLRDVAAAAAKRLTEALRAIEECAKTLAAGRVGVRHAEGDASAGSQLAVHAEAIRYRAYEAEKRLLLALPPSRGCFTGWRLCVLITESLCAHHPWLDVARLAIQGGADCIQLREKGLEDAELLRRARALVELSRSAAARTADGARASAAAVVINDRADIALLARAHGVHLGQGDMSVEDVRRLAGFDLLIGVSTSRIDEARAARCAGADSCGAGPMFESATKQKDRLAGPAYLREYLRADPPLPPVLAISGVTPERIPELVAAAEGRPFGVAVSAAVCSAKDPAAATARLREDLVVSDPAA